MLPLPQSARVQLRHAEWPRRALLLIVSLALGCGQTLSDPSSAPPRVAEGLAPGALTDTAPAGVRPSEGSGPGLADVLSDQDVTPRGPERLGDASSSEDTAPDLPQQAGAPTSLQFSPVASGARMQSETHTLWLNVPAQATGRLETADHRIWLWAGGPRPQ